MNLPETPRKPTLTELIILLVLLLIGLAIVYADNQAAEAYKINQTKNRIERNISNIIIFDETIVGSELKSNHAINIST